MITVDTSALFAFLAGEPDAERLATAMRDEPVVIAAPTWTEASIVVYRKLGMDGVSRLRMLAESLGFEIVSFDGTLAQEAFSAHCRFGKGSGHPAQLNLGDCFAYALTRTRNLPLLFKGDDFSRTDIVSALAGR